VSTRNIPPFRDPAVILADQLKEVFIDGELEIVETASWYPKMYRKDYKIGLNLTGGGVDDPDQQFYENYGCGSPRNYTGYCNPSSKNCSTANRPKPTKASASSWCGRLNGSLPRTVRARSSFTTASPTVGSLR
jgi:hypothetical protein